MHKEQITGILTATLKSGTKTPGIFDLPKVLSIKSVLEGCRSALQVINVLESNRSYLLKVFGLTNGQLDAAIDKIRSL